MYLIIKTYLARDEGLLGRIAWLEHMKRASRPT